MKYSQWLENKIARNLAPSAMPEDEYRLVIDFPKEMHGLRILDVGSGQSGCAAWCNSSGAIIYALDHRYSDLKRLENGVNNSTEDIRKKFLRNFGNGGWESYKNTIDASRNRFREYMNSNPNRHVAAIAGQLPFSDDTFDFIFSINCVTHGLDVEYPVLEHAFGESLRVLRRGHELQVFPFWWSADKKIQGNHKHLLKYLRKNYVPYKEEQVVGRAVRLRVLKP